MAEQAEAEEMSTGRPRRAIKRPNYYRESSALTKTRRTSQKRCQRSDDDALYPVTVVDDDGSRYKVHYIGYSESFDEWRDYSEVKVIDSASVDEVDATEFSLYTDLAQRIKPSLKSATKESPLVRIEMPFDHIVFDGGLGVCGVKKSFVRGSQRYCISAYKDLNHLLGLNWHVRGINKNGDFCYVLLDTLVYYLYHRRPLIEYVPDLDGSVTEVRKDCGYALAFSFVRGDGTPEKFGKDLSIFCN